jgi:large subunit ribosomal protein L25
MDQVLKVEVREKTGKNAARRLRAEGMIPGVVYGKGIESVPVVLSHKELSAVVAGEGGHNNLIVLQGGGSLDGSTIIVADIVREVLKSTPVHVDLHKINLTEKVHVHVPVRLVGTAIGVKEGGLLDFAMHNLDVECLPNQIPEHIDIDITQVAIGRSVHVGDIAVPAGVKLLADAKASVVSVLGKVREEAPAAE